MKMNFVSAALVAAGMSAGFASVSQAAATLVINEVYPGGGSGTAGTAYTRDFVELYNNSALPVPLGGYSLQYASSSGNFTNTIVNFGAGSIIGANDYLSVYTGSAGAAGATLTAGTGAGNVTYVAPTTSASLSAASGAVRLVDASNSVVDLLGYGTVSVGSLGDPKSEGTAAAALPSGNATSFNRTGFADTDSNSADFSSGTPSPNGGTLSAVVIVTPEPATLAALAGLGSLVLGRRRRA